MKKINKFLLALSVFSFCVVGGVSTLNASAQEEITSVNDVNFAMVNGASVRYVLPVDETEEAKEEAYKQNGIKFAVCLSENDYMGLEALEGTTYTSVSYGVLIAPESYGELTPATVFGVGGEKTFDWAVWNEEKGVWEYDADSAYTRITNIVSPTMTWDEELAQYQWSGALTNLKKENLTRKFQGVGYIAYTYVNESKEVTEYVFAENNDNVRSMVQVAQLAVEDPKNASIAIGLTDAYITPVTDVEKTYKVEHYDEFGYLFATTEEKTTIDDSVAISGDYNYISSTTDVARRIVNGTFNAEDDRNVTSINKVYADTNYTLKKYYSNVTFGGTITTNKNDSIGATYPINNAMETVKATFVYPAAKTENDDWKVSARWVTDGTGFLKRFDIKWTGSQLEFMLNDTAVYTASADFATTVKNALAGDGLETYFTVNGKTLSWYFPVSDSAYSVTTFTTDNANVEDATTTMIGITTMNCGSGGALITYDKLSESANIADLGLTVSTIYSKTTQLTCTSSTVAATPAVTVTGSTTSVLVAQVKVKPATEDITASSWALDLRGTVANYHSLAFLTYNGTDLTVGQRSASGEASATSKNVSNVEYALSQLQDNDGWKVVVVRDGTNYEVWVDDNGTLTLMSEYVDSDTAEYAKIGIGYRQTPTSYIGDVLTVSWVLYANTTDVSVAK